MHIIAKILAMILPDHGSAGLVLPQQKNQVQPSLVSD